MPQLLDCWALQRFSMREKKYGGAQCSVFRRIANVDKEQGMVAAFLRWGLDERCFQGWFLYRNWGYSMQLLLFKRKVALQKLGGFGKVRSTPVSSSSPAISPVLEEIRRDRKDYVNVKREFKYWRCKTCQKRIKYLCEEFQVPLHHVCFKPFHCS